MVASHFSRAASAGLGGAGLLSKWGGELIDAIPPSTRSNWALSGCVGLDPRSSVEQHTAASIWQRQVRRYDPDLSAPDAMSKP